MKTDPTTMLARLSVQYSVIFNFAVLLGAMVLAVVATSEVTARLQALASINRREAQEMRNIIDSRDLYNVSVAMAAESEERGEKAKKQTPLDTDEQLAFVRRRVSEARTLLETLIMRGNSVTSSNVLIAMENALSNTVFPAEGDSPLRAVIARGVSIGSVGANIYDEPWGPLDDYAFVGELTDSPGAFFSRILYKVEHTRNDFLMAMTVIACALIGAIVVGLRSGDARFPALSAAVGLGSGFIAFISLRGGRAVFLMEMAGEAPVFNPYGMAFVGILVGLFSGRAYALLTTLVDDLHHRLSSAFQRPATNQAPTIENAKAEVTGEHEALTPSPIPRLVVASRNAPAPVAENDVRPDDSAPAATKSSDGS